MPWFNIIISIASFVIGGAALFYVIKRITTKAIVKQAKELDVPEAFKIMIHKDKKNAVDVGIFNQDENELESFTMQGEDGIASDVPINQWVYL